MSKSTVRRFADLVELAESGETQGRIGRQRSVWSLNEVSNMPGKFVFSNPTTTWCYEPERLLHDERLRHSIRMTAAMHRAMDDGRPEAWSAFVAEWSA